MEKDLVFSVAHLEHGHAMNMTMLLTRGGGRLKYVYDVNGEKAQKFSAAFPGAEAVSDFDMVLKDEETSVIAGAAVPCKRAEIGIQAMTHGKDYFTDKPAITDGEQLEKVKQTAARTGKRYFTYFTDFFAKAHPFAKSLIQQGRIGRVVQVTALAPHKLNEGARPQWFFEKNLSGGILCDLGSHQVSDFLAFSSAQDAEVVYAHSDLCHFKKYPSFEDFGQGILRGDNGAMLDFRVDWLTPADFRTFGDLRTFILGTEGYIEIRKTIDIARNPEGGHIYWADDRGEHYKHISELPDTGASAAFVSDLRNGTEHVMTQRHSLKVAELCLKARDALRPGTKAVG